MKYTAGLKEIQDLKENKQKKPKTQTNNTDLYKKRKPEKIKGQHPLN